MIGMEIWYFAVFIPVALVFYSALMAIDFSKIFKKNSTWQIRIICLLVSISIAFIIADGIYGIIDRFLNLFK